MLAASSPVLASILSSTGALVELQAPCLSDSVLALLLDYIYTGALPYTRSQHQYYNLLTAASYLQIDELQEALMAWQQTEVKAADNTNASEHEDINNTGSTPSKYLPLSLEREDHQYSANVDMCDDTDPCRSKNGANHFGRKDQSTVSTCCSISGSTENSVNTGNCRQVPQDLIQNVHRTAEVHGVSGVDKEVQKDQFHSAGTIKPETWQRSREEELEKTVDDRRSLILLRTAEVKEGRAEKTQSLCLTVKSKAEETQTIRKEEDKTLICHSTSHLKDSVSPSQCSSSSSSSSPHLCCGAVPVIRHSSRAAEVSPMLPPYLPVSQASVSSSRTPDSGSGSTDSDSIAEGTKMIVEGQNQYYRNNKEYVGNQSWDHNDSRNGEQLSNGLSHIADHNDHRADCDSFQKNKKYIRDDSVPQNKDCNFARRLKYKTDFASKHQRMDCSDCHNVWMATAAEERSIHSQDPRAPLPVQDSETGSNLHCEDLCYEGEAKEEGSSLRCPVETDRQDSFCNLQSAESSTKDASSDSDNRDTATTDHVFQPFSTKPESSLDNVTVSPSGFERRTSVELESMSITEPNLTFSMSVDHNMSDPTYSLVGPSYRGHLRYHCLPSREETHLPHRYSARKHSNPDHSDQSSDEEDGAFASPGYSPLRQHFAPVATDQVLLLDISAKPAELLVANAFGRKETFGNGLGYKDREHWNKATSVASWVGGTNVEERTSVGSREAEVIHKAGVENQAATLTDCSPHSVPDSVQASMSSTLSVCIPSTLSASVPTNVSAHLSNPVHHPFQCSLCDRSFSQRGSLNRHVRSHLGVRPFPCPRCPMTFSRQYRVTEHMRVHQRCVLLSDYQKPPASSI